MDIGAIWSPTLGPVQPMTWLASSDFYFYFLCLPIIHFGARSWARFKGIFLKGLSSGHGPKDEARSGCGDMACSRVKLLIKRLSNLVA